MQYIKIFMFKNLSTTYFDLFRNHIFLHAACPLFSWNAKELKFSLISLKKKENRKIRLIFKI